METVQAFAASANLTLNDVAQYLAFALGVVNVALIVRRSIWNYAFGIGSVAAALVSLFIARLYSEAALQIFFIVVNVYGWVKWNAARHEAGAIIVLVLRPVERFVWCVGIVAAGLALGWAMDSLTNAALPYPDALITSASIAAQILLALRRIENWVLWILVDLVAVPLYISREIYPLAALYGIFLILSVAGLVAWSQALRQREPPAR
jgi:nicotinamide mononucleotide transporter